MSLTVLRDTMGPGAAGRGAGLVFWCLVFVLELFMKRYPVSKKASAKKFRGHVGQSKVINLKGAPMRGGIRL